MSEQLPQPKGSAIGNRALRSPWAVFGAVIGLEFAVSLVVFSITSPTTKSTNDRFTYLLLVLFAASLLMNPWFFRQLAKNPRYYTPQGQSAAIGLRLAMGTSPTLYGIVAVVSGTSRWIVLVGWATSTALLVSAARSVQPQ